MNKLSYSMMYVILLFTPNLFAADSQFEVNERLKDLPANTAINLGKFSWEKPAGEPHAGSVTDYSGMCYDVHNHRILLFGGGHSATWTDAIYAFDFKTLSSEFKALYTPTPHSLYTQENFDRGFWKADLGESYPRPAGRHTYDLLIVPDDRKEFLMLRTGTGPSMAAKGFGYVGGAGGKYDFNSAKWTMIDKKHLPFGGYGGVAEYDPISKKVIGLHGQLLTVYDPASNTSQVVVKNIAATYKDRIGYSGCMVYYPPDQRMYIFSMKAKHVWALELNRDNFKESKFIQMPDSGKGPAIETSYVYDHKNKLLGGGLHENVFHAFNPQTQQWESQAVQGGTPTQIRFHNIAYSPIDNAYIFIAKDRHVWAYRWK